MKPSASIQRFFLERSGAASAEYALILSVIVLGLGYATFQLGSNIEHALGNAANGIHDQTSPADGSGGGTGAGPGGAYSDGGGTAGDGSGSGGSGGGDFGGGAASGGGTDAPDGSDGANDGEGSGGGGSGGGFGPGDIIPGDDGDITPDPEPDPEEGED